MNTQTQDRPRVLIVDDQKNWRDALHDMLNPQKYEIVTVDSYDQAKSELHRRAYHVLVSDQRLVDSDESNIQGILLLDEVEKLKDGTQAIIVTGYPTVTAAKNALRGYDAHDYILKYPEESGPFNIRKYREQVEEAAAKANVARGKAVTVDFSISAVVPGVTYDLCARTLFPEASALHDVVGAVRTVLNRLAFSLQPLAHRKGRAWLSKSHDICEILCWSREHCMAALLRIGKEADALEHYEVQWLQEHWCLTQREQLVSGLIAGVSYTVDSLSFEEFTALVEGS